MNQCPFIDNGFCAKPGVVSIDEMGMCNIIWRKGQQRNYSIPFTDDIFHKEKIIIEEFEDKEENGTRQEDLMNGETA